MTIYKLVNLCKSFTMNGSHIDVLKDLSFSLEAGQWIAITGPSGSGKTTLLQLLGGLDRPTSGSIFLDNIDIAALSNRRLTALRHKAIGFVFQSYHLFPELTAIENVALPALNWFSDRNAVFAQAKTWLVKFGLEKRLFHRPQELSGGEQQRVAIARALINNPKIILADEPTGNLDPAASQQIIDILNLIRHDADKTIVMVTHDLNLARQADNQIKLS